ncbi:MAG: hypothetical protein P8Y71_29185 [Pseudolabrys sp.]
MRVASAALNPDGRYQVSPQDVAAAVDRHRQQLDLNAINSIGGASSFDGLGSSYVAPSYAAPSYAGPFYAHGSTVGHDASHAMLINDTINQVAAQHGVPPADIVASLQRTAASRAVPRAANAYASLPSPQFGNMSGSSFALGNGGAKYGTVV